MVAEDVHILQQYLASEPRTSPRPRQPYNVVSNAPGNPMIYLAVPGRRERLKWAKDPGHDQREILEQILGPKKRDVIELYFTHIHPAFPVLDEEEFIRADGDAVSSALLCEVYAISLTFWDVSGLLKHQHCPSDQYFWNLAIAALQDDFLSPNLLTLYASVVDLLGRPVGSVQGNVVNAGRAMALAYSLGLNRDPSAWKFADRDKRLRMRLFWGCMVLDQWSSFAHGIPPSITRKQHDVPLPSVTVLLTPGNESDDRIKAAECFIQLCKLSQILGDVLSYVYDLSEQHKGIWKELRRLECDLDEWEGGLPEHLQAEALENSTSVSGASSLHLGYLSVRMLLCRVSLRAASWEDTLDAGDIRQYHMTTLRRAATRITDFVVSLRSCQLKEFWLSFTGHLLVASATVLLRCAIDTSDATVAKGCKESLRSLQKRLHLAKAQDDWDLADMFIKRCDEPITRIITEPPPGSRENRSNTARYLQDQEHSQGQMEVQDVFDFTQSTYSDFHVSMGTVDHPWESLWDMLEGP
ncbi:Transcription factor fungi [Macrophomina phaseolina MS6]|uniref:Transcription factor fungi n=1 Tax=Macrophomina phaseolina (strain MS6) TaxID=1126212 RepID=K2RZ17_MACPH|nr:Transcription factor fungi [Macrophomina phaseolina MS6]